MEPIEQLEIVVSELSGLVKGVRDDQLENPTPCDEWTVRDLLGHFAGGTTSCLAALADGTPVDVTPRVDLLGDDPRATLSELFDRFDTAVHAPGAMERTFTLPFGELPAPAFYRFLTFDLMTHSWDLATATGQKYAPPEDLVREADAFARQAIAAEMRGVVFADARPEPADASPLECLVAFTGRRP
jgi:uncharacterized protein (TIGR03086 family)